MMNLRNLPLRQIFMEENSFCMYGEILVTLFILSY